MKRKEFKQEVVLDKGTHVLVKSITGKIYPIIKSDNVKDKEFHEGDIAIVHKTYGRYFIHDVIPGDKEWKENHYILH